MHSDATTHTSPVHHTDPVRARVMNAGRDALEDIGGRLTRLAKHALRAPSGCTCLLDVEHVIHVVGDKIDVQAVGVAAVRANAVATSEDRTAMAAPIEVDGQPVGALVIADPAPRTWSDADAGLLADFAETIAIELTGRLDAKLADERLSVETSRLVAMLESLHAAVLVEDSRRYVQYANSHFCDMMAIPAPPAALVGMDCSGAAHEHKGMFRDPEAFVKRIDQILADRETVREEIIELADGRVWERDYGPTFADSSYCGHLWTYRDVTHKEQARRALEIDATTDALTGLRNRRGFIKDASRLLAASAGQPVALFFADLDGMKGINDRLGHDVGDLALKATADVMRASFRADDVLARLGGDEFVALAAGVCDARAQRVLERIQRVLDARNAQPDLGFQLRASVGVATHAATECASLEDLLAASDACMYSVKQARRAA